MNFPETKKEEISDEMFGVVVADPYRWLEDVKNHKTKEWIHAQNVHTGEVLRNETFEIFSDELVRNFEAVDFSVPYLVRGRYFYHERKPGEDQWSFYVKKGIDAEPVKLIDPNGMSADNTISLDFCYVSRTGKYLAYGLSQGGDEMPTLYVKNIDTLKDLSEAIPRCKHAQALWLPDDSGFFYKRNPEAGAVPQNEEHLHTKVYFHKLDNDSKNDELIFGEGRPKDDIIDISLSLDGRYLAIGASQKWIENDIYIYDHESKQTTPLVVGVSAQFSGFFLKDRVIIHTNYKANNYRVLSVPLDSIFAPIDEWREIIPEKEYVLKAVFSTKDKILAEYIDNACSKVIIFDYEGKEKEEIGLPPYSTITAISTRREEEEFFYGVMSFIFPKIVYRYIPKEAKFIEYRKADNPIDQKEYIVKQEWYKSKDGTRIPMFVFHKDSLKNDGTNPTILYAYGGFGSIQSPSFKKSFVPWLERGGIFAVANIRGGGEFGEAWHKGGIKEKKQNSFDDFISAAEYLVEQKYTDSKHLGILGGSNGGLLVSAVAVQRPDLFSAVCSTVPLTDMVRFPLFGMALRWVHEYGNPENEVDLKNILKWSPYHNVKEGIEYPSFLFTTAEKDSRVDPLHARKMTAMLQSVNNKNDVLLFVEKEAGHGSGKPITKIVESQAMILTFFVQKLELPRSIL